MKTLNINVPVNPTADDINIIGLAALLQRKTIIHTVEAEGSSALEMHTHNRLSQGLLDVRIKLPLGDHSTNVTPSLFENMVGDPSCQCLSVSDELDKDVLFDVDKQGHTVVAEPEDKEAYRNPLLDEVSRAVNYSTFIIREECEIEKHHGQMLPWRYVQIVWAHEEGIPLEEQIAEFEDVDIHALDENVMEFIKVNGAILEEFLIKAADEVTDGVNQYLDPIALDSDYPNLETDIAKDVLEEAMANFYSARDQLPNNPFFLHMPPRSMTKDELAIYDICYNENIDRYNPACSISPEANSEYQPDANTMQFVKERMKARIGIYHPDDIPEGIEGEWGDDIVRSHRGIIFVPFQHFNLTFMQHLNDDTELRLKELDMFFEELTEDVVE